MKSSNSKFNPGQMTNTLTVSAALTALLLWGVTLIFPDLDIPEVIIGAIYTLVNYLVGGFTTVRPDGRHEA